MIKMNALRIKNTSESDPRSYVVTKQLQRNPRKKLLLLTDEGLLFGFGENKMAQLGQGHQKPLLAKPVQVQYESACCMCGGQVLLVQVLNCPCSLSHNFKTLF